MILVIDEGTTSSRAMLFAPDGRCLGSEQRDLQQHYPGPGLVEHDAEEIWEKSLECARAMVAKAGGAARIAAIGISNQRETILFWSRRTGRALAPAIVWQDRRTADLCGRLKEAGHEGMVQAKTGLRLDPYFSASKIAWALENWPEVKEAGDDLMVGTVESWLVYRLTGGLHVTDVTNASRTGLMEISAGRWDEELLDLWGVPRSALPEIVDCAGRYGSSEAGLFGGAIPICGMGRRPAGGVDRAGVPAAGRHQGHLRHRRLRPHQHGRGFAAVAAPAPGDGGLAARGQAKLCSGRVDLRRRQPDQVASRRAKAAGEFG